MNYQIITDEQALREYIEWLPELKENEKFYCCLFARKKYCKDVKYIKSDKSQLKRFTSDKERLFDKIAQLECPLGAYKQDGVDIPQEALGLYITPNPRDLWKANINAIIDLANVIKCQGKSANPHQEVISTIQRSCGTKKWIHFDIDSKDNLDELIDIVDGICDVVETRGGYHVFVHREQVNAISNKLWYPAMAKFADVKGDAMTPVCGTYQGGFTPRIIRKYEPTIDLLLKDT